MKKIFISHASKDADIVSVFVDKILNLGLNVNPDDIAYTSRQDTGVDNGQSIPQYIKDNISSCDFVFFMISDNYRKSEICLNEMGAAWATDRNVRILVFPDVEFDSIGWLYGFHKGVKINDSAELDALYDDFATQYKTSVKVAAWNRNKKEFLEFVSSKQKTSLPVVVEVGVGDEDDDMGFIDYRIKFDEYNAEFCSVVRIITDATVELRERLPKRTKQLLAANSNPDPNIRLIKSITMTMANDLNQLSDVIDKQEPNLKEFFEKVVNYAVKMHKVAEIDEQTKENNRVAIVGLVESIASAKSAIIGTRRSFVDTSSIEQSYNKAKNRSIKCYDKLISAFDYCIAQANDLIKL